MRLKIVLAAAVATVFSAANAWELKPGLKIVVPDEDGTGVSRAIASAAAELSRYVAEATGVRLAVVPSAKAGRADGAIYLGEAAAKRAGFACDGFRGFENVIAEKDGCIYLFGKDRPGHRSEKRLNWDECILPTVRAVTRFMESFAGVRYLGPGDTGVEVRKVARMTVPDGFQDRETPRMAFDCGRYFGMMYSIANGVFGRGAFRTYGGHIYPDAVPYAKYRETHPEYFGLIGADRAQSQPGNPVLCISNPDVKRLVIERIAADFDAGYEIVELGQNDGGSSCQCERCRAYGGTSVVSEKFWLFHREIAAELEKTHPDKTVAIINYGLTSEPPMTFREFPSNVMVELMKTSPKAFRIWSGYKVPRGFCVYIYLWGEYQIPGLTAKESFPALVEAAHRFLGNGVKGIYRCGFGELFGTEAPGYYLFNRTMLDPSAGSNALLAEFYASAYGKAAGPMRSFFDTLDGRIRGVNKISDGFEAPGAQVQPVSAAPRDSLDAIAYLYTPSACVSMDGFLSRAEATEGLNERQRRRIALARREFDYARNLGRIATLYPAFRLNPVKTFFEPLAEAISERNAMLDSLYDGAGRMKPFPGWPEVRVFGGFDRGTLLHNGRLAATLNAPLTWDVKLMREKGIVPGGPAKSTKAAAALEGSPWNELGGMQLDRLDYRTRFRVARGDEALLVEVEAELPDDLTFDPLGHDGYCYSRECIDLFVDPTGRRERSFHFIWNPVANSYYEDAFGLIADPLDPRFDAFNVDWNGKWNYTTERKDGIWRSVVSIPYASLETERPAAGDRWLLNLGRETFKPGDLQLGLWNPSLEGRGMRDLEAMGTVVFE